MVIFHFDCKKLPNVWMEIHLDTSIHGIEVLLIIPIKLGELSISSAFCWFIAFNLHKLKISKSESVEGHLLLIGLLLVWLKWTFIFAFYGRSTIWQWILLEWSGMNLWNGFACRSSLSHWTECVDHNKFWLMRIQFTFNIQWHLF